MDSLKIALTGWRCRSEYGFVITRSALLLPSYRPLWRHRQLTTGSCTVCILSDVDSRRHLRSGYTPYLQDHAHLRATGRDFQRVNLRPLAVYIMLWSGVRLSVTSRSSINAVGSIGTLVSCCQGSWRKSNAVTPEYTSGTNNFWFSTNKSLYLGHRTR